MDTKIEELDRYEEGPLTIVVELHADYDCDMSHLGEYVDKYEDYVFDRKNGYLLIDKQEPDYDEYVPEDISFVTDEQLEVMEDKYEAAYEEWEEFPWDVVAESNIARFDRREYRYFRVFNHNPPGNVKNWTHVEDVLEHYKSNLSEVRKFHIKTPDEPTLEEAIYALEVFYMCQDYERMEGLMRGDWSMTGILVTIYVDGKDVACASLWGIESDCGQDYVDEITRDLIAQATAELPKSAERYASIADKIREAIA